MSSPAPALTGNWQKKRKDGPYETEEAKAQRSDSITTYQQRLKEIEAKRGREAAGNSQ